jgi:6-pyruvoyl-tetrahydropterin synthase
VVKPLIDQLDHAFIVWSEDPLAAGLVAMSEAESFRDKLIVVDFNPTLEGLAQYLFEKIQADLPLKRAFLRRVDLDATQTLRASYFR